MRITSKSFGGACRIVESAAIAALTFVGFAWNGIGVAQADPLLDEMVEFTGQIFFIESKVPAVVIGALRNGEVSVRGFGERSDVDKRAPDGDTLLRLGSITKAFTGEMLAHLTADDEQKKRMMQGHDPDGKALPDVPTGSVIVGSGGLYSTPNDLLRWMQWVLPGWA
ncbi:MAG: hypothetical protein WA441_13140 [Methyloceanibacter sp.]